MVGARARHLDRGRQRHESQATDHRRRRRSRVVAEFDVATMKPIYKPELQIANPRWAPVGSQIAFIEGLMSDEGSTGGDLFVMPASGGSPRNLTPNLKASVTTFKWLSPTSLLLGENVSGEAALVRMQLDGTSTELRRG